MPRRNGHVPAYRLHRPSGQARVIINHEHIYFGKYGSAESREKYARLIGELAIATGIPATITDASRDGSPISVSRGVESHSHPISIR